VLAPRGTNPTQGDGRVDLTSDNGRVSDVRLDFLPAFAGSSPRVEQAEPKGKEVQPIARSHPVVPRGSPSPMHWPSLP